MGWTWRHWRHCIGGEWGLLYNNRGTPIYFNQSSSEAHSPNITSFTFNCNVSTNTEVSAAYGDIQSFRRGVGVTAQSRLPAVLITIKSHYSGFLIIIRNYSWFYNNYVHYGQHARGVSSVAERSNHLRPDWNQRDICQVLFWQFIGRKSLPTMTMLDLVSRIQEYKMNWPESRCRAIGTIIYRVNHPIQ